MPKEFYKNVAIQMVGDDESPVAPKLIEKSVYLQTAFSLNLARIIGPAATDIETAQLGPLWDDVPSVSGQYTFEIATVLPYYLPNFEDMPDYVVRVGDTDLVVSSRMLRCFYSQEGSEENQLQYYLVHRCALDNLLQQKPLTHIHPVPLRTFITKRITVDATNAEQAIQANFYSWVREFVIDLSRFLDSIRAASPKDAKHLLPQSATPFLSIFWICVSGNNNKIGIAQFAGDVPSAAFRSLSTLDRDSVARVHEFLATGAAIPVHESALALANTYLHYGYLGLALVQTCIACESVLAQIYETFLTSRGVSKTKYAEAERDITFSQLLNLHLAAARDLSKMEDRGGTLNRLNWARRCRNEMVHKGALQQNVTTQEVADAINSAARLIKFLLADPGTNDS
ncbi:MAG: hypothetical protein WD045_06790 [Pirellulaceae bacterium]